MDSIVFILSGFAVVLLALGMLWSVSALIGRIFVKLSSDRPAGAASASAAAAAAAAGQTDASTAPSPPTPLSSPSSSARTIPAAHLAAISAAIAEITHGRGRVVSVLAPAQVFTSWAQEGRTEQFSSHRVRWDWAVSGPPHVSNEPPREGA